MDNTKQKSKSIACLFALFFGSFGVHKYYLNAPKIGLIYLLFCWTFIPMLASIIEAIIFLCTPKEKFDNKYNRNTLKNKNKKNKNTNVSDKYICNGKEYLIKGKRDSFIIKNKSNEFLIQNGEIIAFRNKKSKMKFIEYSRGAV